ncbi:MAG: hypothetical protein Q7V17_21280 [Afipia sp.]|nr:hypothetical protein [Afipia sp.]
MDDGEIFHDADQRLAIDAGGIKRLHKALELGKASISRFCRITLFATFGLSESVLADELRPTQHIAAY